MELNAKSESVRIARVSYSGGLGGWKGGYLPLAQSPPSLFMY